MDGDFPWIRLQGVPQPDVKKLMVNYDLINILDVQETRAYLGDGNFGGLYQRSGDDMLAIWQVAIEETRALITDGWGL